MRPRHSIIVFLSTGLLAAAEPLDGSGEAFGRFLPYEPLYAVLTPNDHKLDTADQGISCLFQVSFAYEMVTFTGLARAPGDTRNDGFYMSYSQTAFWDITEESKPFYDTSYRPELWFHLGCAPALGAEHLGLEFGYAHESNGKAGDDSRSMDKAFVRPIARWRLARDWTLLADPRALWYPQDRDNPDIDRYRGHADLHLALTQADGWKIALLGRIGSTGDYGSLLTEVSYPLQLHAFDCTRTQHRHWTDAYIYAQAFIGYGRTLLDYDVRAPDPACALGIAFVR